MALTSGTRLGLYEIVALLGAGGMGEVYRAQDTKLGRAVAVKILPEAFAFDPDRVARFDREAKLLASLNHPHIAALYGMEESGGRHFLVMELVEGETLADRLRRGPIPVEDTLRLAHQIADALEAAHEKGIIHRDLKPANVKTTPDEKVKVLDFGLAKLQPGGSGEAGGSGADKVAQGSPANLTHSPTLSMMATQAGVILGTAAYMSPEQAKGLPADHRSDVFSFGSVLYEMLTGRQPFQGDTAPDMLASVLVREPDLNALPSNLNPRILELIRRCLEKNPKRRWQAVGDLRAEIEAVAAVPRAVPAVTGVMTPPTSLWKRAIPIASTALVAAAFTSAAWWSSRPATPTIAVTRFTFTLPEGQQFSNTNRQIVAISPDGQHMAYVANGRLYLRSMSDLEARPVTGSLGIVNPAFSQDGRSLAFYSIFDRTLKRIGVGGGAAVSIGQFNQNPYGVSWSQDGILFGQGSQGIMRVSPNGGKPEQLVKVGDGEVAQAPQMLPGGRAVLFTLGAAFGGEQLDRASIVVQSLTSGERKALIEGGSDGRYLATGHIVYALGGTLFAVRFDLGRLQVTGGPVAVLEGVRRAAGGAAGSASAYFGFSDTGSLVYIPGPASTSSRQLNLALIDRKGAVDTLKLPQGPYESPRISPNGKRIAFDTDDGKEAIVWIYELSGASAMRRLTFGGRNRFPIWSSDGERVAFQSDRDGDLGIFWQHADGSGAAERLTKPEQGESHIPESWSPKGDRFSFSVVKGPSASLWMFSLQDRKTAPFGNVQSTYPLNSAFSPDGRWLAYTLRAATGAAVYVQPFPITGALYQVSKDDTGHHPLWSPDGKELFYFPGGSQLVSVSVATRPSLTLGNPIAVPGGFSSNTFQTDPRNHDITQDGQQFVTVVDSAQTQSRAPTAPHIQVVLNWFEELKQRVPLGK